MKRNTRFLFVALLGAGFMFTSCSGEPAVEEDAPVEVVIEESPTLYQYDASSSTVGFTAYKFLNKTGVGGTFSDFTVTATESSENPKDVIESLSIEIPITGISTKDEGRDEKINKFFFGEINTSVITGNIKSLDDEGKAVIEITMNEVTNDVEGEYTLEDGAFEFSADIDVLDWNGEAGITALNTECKDLHTDHANGDTESKLWSEVSITFSTQLEAISQ